MSFFKGNGKTINVNSTNPDAIRKAYAAVKAVQDGTVWVLSNIDYSTEGSYKFSITADDRDTRLNVDYVRTLVGPATDLTLSEPSAEPDAIADVVEAVAGGAMTPAAAAATILAKA